MIAFLLSFVTTITLAYTTDFLQLDGCKSVREQNITHFDKPSIKNPTGKKILVIGMIHGDEPEALELSHRWIERLRGLEPSNHWRIVPNLNPDGYELKTRANANNVDLNRNFPTKDWDSHALLHWKNTLNENKRRYPGPNAGSEVETQCAIKHIEDFKPDVIVALHTPYALLDFDGPKDKKIKFKSLPWRKLGTFTGSLGRYMWDERHVPVLTVEIKPQSFKKHLSEFLWLQDQISYLAN